MAAFLENLGTKIEDFFATDTAAILGAVFIAATVIFVLLLLRIFEKN